MTATLTQSPETPEPTMSRQDAELAELAGGFIHEIKNHLSTLGLNLQLLAEDFDEPESQKERRALTRVHKLQVQCQHLVDVSNDFLRFARIKDLDVEPTNLNTLIDELTDFLGPTAQTANININTYLPTNLPFVQLEPDLFKQALLNLLLNAEQAMPQGGDITLQAATESTPTGNGCLGPNSSIILHVIDTGKGMSSDVLARIFEPFFSTKETGHGLGLPTTKRIIEAHGGSLDVESAVDHGTRFTISLPLSQ